MARPPKFITTAVVKLAVETVMKATFDNPAMSGILSKQMGHLVVIVPGTARDDRGISTVVPVVFYERSFDLTRWTSQYAEIAMSKAMQLWRGQNIDGNTDSMPHLLYHGETPYWGGVKRKGIVVAFSGVQSYFDQMISGMVADMIIALARHAWETSTDKAERHPFLT